jgi:predicted TIM-barrel fold metal-dependent hydrolase
MQRFSRGLLCALPLCLLLPWGSTHARPPIIDMHLHARKGDYSGAELPKLCVPPDANAPCPHPLVAVTSATQFMRDTLAVMTKRNIIGMVSGEPDTMAAWKAAAPDRIIVGSDLRILQGTADGRLKTRTPEELRALHAAGLLDVIGEVMAQYEGIAPSDARLEPYWALAESLDIPVGIHMGPGGPGDPYNGSPNYRARNSSALGLEETLVHHPRLRVYIMHAGYPFIADLRAVLFTHPQVYVDISAIVSGEPRAAFYRYLQELVEAGFGDRVMFGSDPGLWPSVIEASIEAIEQAPFLTPAQQRAILYDNAARFLRLSEQTIARHRAM